MEKYAIVDPKVVKGKVRIRRLSDNLIAWCKPGWLKASGQPDVHVPRSKTKAIRLDGLDWTTEE